MKTLIYLLLVILFSLHTAMSCDNVESTYWTITNIDVKNIDQANRELFSKTDSIESKDYGITFRYTGSDINGNTEYMRYNDYGASNYFLLNYKSRNFYGITITCNMDFDENHPAGSDVTEFFSLYPDRRRANSDNDIQYYRLTKQPKTGLHSFKIQFYENDELRTEKNTKPVILF